MNSGYFPIARIDLPDNWQPTGLTCVVFPCPADQQYVSMLIGIVDQLRWSRSYARDATRTGAATVARTWNDALLTKPVLVECPMLVRQNAADPCTLEYSTDGGVTWVAWADLQLCPPVLRIADGTLEWYDPATGGWFPVPDPNGEPSPPYDPAVDGPIDEPYPTVPPGIGSVPCLAAYNAAETLRLATGEFSFVFAGAGTIIQVVQSILENWMNLIGLGILAQRVTDNYLDVQADLNAATILADHAAFDWVAFRELLHCYYNDKGVMTAERWRALLAVMSNEIGQIWRLLEFYVRMAGPVGMTAATLLIGTVDPGCVTSCDWEHVFDFTLNNGGWTAEVGQYVAGSGWRSGLVNLPGDCTYRVCQLSRALPARTITYYRAEYHATLGFQEPPPAPEARNGFISHTDFTIPNRLATEGGGSGNLAIEWAGEVPGITFLGFAKTVGYDCPEPAPDPGGQVTLKKIILRGQGTDPFV